MSSAGKITGLRFGHGYSCGHDENIYSGDPGFRALLVRYRRKLLRDLGLAPKTRRRW